jgi:glycerol-3-phosphate dehydrogenase
MVTVTGGKLTTYRKMAQDTVDAVVASLGRRSLRCVTKDLRVRGSGGGVHAPALAGGARPGGELSDADRAARIAAHLAGRYGSETPDVLALVGIQPDLLDPLVEGLEYLRVEALYAVRNEMARTVADVLDRRTRASLRDARAAARAARGVASLIGPELGWDAATMAEEARAYSDRVRAELTTAGLDPDVLPPTDEAVATGGGTTEGG